MSTEPHARPAPPRRLPRVLPVPPRPAPPRPSEGLHRIVYDEVYQALIQNGRHELTAVAIALSVARKVMARASLARIARKV